MHSMWSMNLFFSNEEKIRFMYVFCSLFRILQAYLIYSFRQHIDEMTLSYWWYFNLRFEKLIKNSQNAASANFSIYDMRIESTMYFHNWQQPTQKTESYWKNGICLVYRLKSVEVFGSSVMTMICVYKVINRTKNDSSLCLIQ